VIGIIFLACVFSISEGRSEIALTQAQEQKAAEIDSLIRYYHEQGIFNGTVLVAEAGKVIYQEGFGYANVDTKERLEPKSVFRLASLSKQFTAMCIMILEEQGKLNYDDNLQKYIPELKYEGITIRHLLWHTSGIPRYMEFMAKRFSDDEWYVNADVIETLAKDHPEKHFEPGEKYEYSNTGYLLLASVVERASGVPFKNFLHQNIFDKLGMSSSIFPFGKKEFDEMANRVRGYNRKKDGEYVDNDYIDFDYDVFGDGGVFSNVIDLFKWNEALATEKLVTKDTIQEAYKPYVLNDGSVGDYGFGWSVSEVDANKIVEHSGSWIGFRTYILRDITNNHCVIVLTNLGNRKGAKLYNAFYNILMGKPYLRIINIERKTVKNAQKIPSRESARRVSKKSQGTHEWH
jgi:CubicO group peptidase (beta-lactamase class C family)